MADYTFQTITVNYPGALSTNVDDINDAGQIVGSYYSNGNHGYEYQNGVFQNLDYTGSSDTFEAQTIPTAISDDGVVAGYYTLNGGGNYQGFIERDGSFTTLQNNNSVANFLWGINSAGTEIVGSYRAGRYTWGAIFTQDGSLTTIVDPQSFRDTDLSGVNAAGAIVGNRDFTIGFTYINGVFSDLSYPGATQTSLSDINDTGTIIGDYTDSVGAAHGFVEANGVFSSLDYPGATTTNLGRITSAGKLFGGASFADGSSVTFLATPVCFAPDTRIATKLGVTEIEALVVGDLVVTTAGGYRPVRWLGHRTVDCRRHPRPHEVLPIRIAAHAFAPNRPARDLVLSPGHSIAVDVLGEVLIPASALVNGATIRQEPVESVTYWHVELDSHDVILAENLPCESYLEMGNRDFFEGDGVVALHATPDAPVATHADFCRPFHADGPLVAFVRERLAARAAALGWALAENPLAGLHLVADGRRVEPEVRGLSARFLLPAAPSSAWLVSDTAVPAEINGSTDRRRLGVCVGRLVVDDGFEVRAIAADDPRLCAGFHDAEAGPQRWTAGRACLPSELWDGCRGAFFLRVDLARPALPRRIVPAEAAETLAMAG